VYICVKTTDSDSQTLHPSHCCSCSGWARVRKLRDGRSIWTFCSKQSERRIWTRWKNTSSD